MRCYYQTDGETWHRGYMWSQNGNTEVEFKPAQGSQGSQGETLVLYRPEILFFDEEVHVTGWLRVDDTLYKLKGVDVRFTKPRKKKP